MSNINANVTPVVVVPVSFDVDRSQAQLATERRTITCLEANKQGIFFSEPHPGNNLLCVFEPNNKTYCMYVFEPSNKTCCAYWNQTRKPIGSQTKGNLLGIKKGRTHSSRTSQGNVLPLHVLDPSCCVWEPKERNLLETEQGNITYWKPRRENSNGTKKGKLLLLLRETVVNETKYC